MPRKVCVNASFASQSMCMFLILRRLTGLKAARTGMAPVLEMEDAEMTAE